MVQYTQELRAETLAMIQESLALESDDERKIYTDIANDPSIHDSFKIRLHTIFLTERVKLAELDAKYGPDTNK